MFTDTPVIETFAVFLTFTTRVPCPVPDGTVSVPVRSIGFDSLVLLKLVIEQVVDPRPTPTVRFVDETSLWRHWISACWEEIVE